MTPELLVKVGKALYPSDWTMWLCGDLGIGIRPLRRMANGDAPIPQNLPTELLALIKQRQGELAAIENTLLGVM